MKGWGWALARHPPTFIRKQEQRKSGGASFIPSEHEGLKGTLLLPSNSLLKPASVKPGSLNDTNPNHKNGTTLLLAKVWKLCV